MKLQALAGSPNAAQARYNAGIHDGHAPRHSTRAHLRARDGQGMDARDCASPRWGARGGGGPLGEKICLMQKVILVTCTHGMHSQVGGAQREVHWAPRTRLGCPHSLPQRLACRLFVHSLRHWRKQVPLQLAFIYGTHVSQLNSNVMHGWKCLPPIHHQHHHGNRTLASLASLTETLLPPSSSSP